MIQAKDKAALFYIMAEAMTGQITPLIDKRSKETTIKNKYNLSDEQKEFIKTLSAKEKKKYFKDA